MKIVALETHIVAVPPPHVGGMYWLFVKLKTDCGIEGVGEIYAATFGPKAMLPIIEDVFERYLLNHDPHHIERFFRQAYSSGFTQRPDLTMMGVVSGLEMACWDLLAQSRGVPLADALGHRGAQHVEAGVSLDSAILRVAKDMEQLHPELSHELLVVNRRVNAGMTRESALHGLWQRTGVEELRALASSMIQSEKWGTSISKVLRVASD